MDKLSSGSLGREIAFSRLSVHSDAVISGLIESTPRWRLDKLNSISIGEASLRFRAKDHETSMPNATLAGPI